MKVLNLYAGIGGNRKLWTDCDVTAVEINPEIAKVYKGHFPGDEVVVGDAHKFLLENYKEYDFIWSSPPCPSHSEIRRCGTYRGQQNAIYPDMGLYQEVILLEAYAKKSTRWVVENVNPYYTPLIPPTKKLHRHLYWSNFRIGNFDVTDDRKHLDIKVNSTIYGFNIYGTNIKNKVKVLRNMVDPSLGLHIFNAAKGIITNNDVNQGTLFAN